MRLSDKVDCLNVENLSLIQAKKRIVQFRPINSDQGIKIKNEKKKFDFVNQSGSDIIVLIDIMKISEKYEKGAKKIFSHTFLLNRKVYKSTYTFNFPELDYETSSNYFLNFTYYIFKTFRQIKQQCSNVFIVLSKIPKNASQKEDELKLENIPKSYSGKTTKLQKKKPKAVKKSAKSKTKVTTKKKPKIQMKKKPKKAKKNKKSNEDEELKKKSEELNEESSNDKESEEERNNNKEPEESASNEESEETGSSCYKSLDSSLSEDDESSSMEVEKTKTKTKTKKNSNKKNQSKKTKAKKNKIVN